MKRSFHNILFPVLFPAALISLLLTACNGDDESGFNPTYGMKQVATGYAPGSAAKVEVWSTEELFAGLNKVYIALYDSVSNSPITNAHIQLNPIMKMATMSHSCPVLNPGEQAIEKLFPSEVMFTMPSGDMGSWTLAVKVNNHVAGKSGTGIFDIDVEATDPSRVISFQAESAQRYYLSYLFPNGMKVGVNDFDVVAYTYQDGSFVPAEDLLIEFTPEMPSMDHGSPNNSDPVYRSDGHYAGKANFTMTGEWRLNLRLSDGSNDLGTRHFDVIVN